MKRQCFSGTFRCGALAGTTRVPPGQRPSLSQPCACVVCHLCLICIIATTAASSWAQACRGYIHVIDAALQPPVTPTGATLPFNQTALGDTNQTGALPPPIMDRLRLLKTPGWHCRQNQALATLSLVRNRIMGTATCSGALAALLGPLPRRPQRSSASRGLHTLMVSDRQGRLSGCRNTGAAELRSGHGGGPAAGARLSGGGAGRCGAGVCAAAGRRCSAGRHDRLRDHTGGECMPANII